MSRTIKAGPAPRPILSHQPLSMRNRSYCRSIPPFLALSAALLVLHLQPAQAQLATPELSPSTTVEQAAKLVRWTGTLPESAGKSVELTFAIYENAAGGSALWTEAQRVTVASDGHYSVLLGAATSEGLPQTLFPSGQTRWIEARTSGSLGKPGEETTAPRALLAAVPYAFKAVDADTLAGRAASRLRHPRRPAIYRRRRTPRQHPGSGRSTRHLRHRHHQLPAYLVELHHLRQLAPLSNRRQRRHRHHQPRRYARRQRQPHRTRPITPARRRNRDRLGQPTLP